MHNAARADMPEHSSLYEIFWLHGQLVQVDSLSELLNLELLRSFTKYNKINFYNFFFI